MRLGVQEPPLTACWVNIGFSHAAIARLVSQADADMFADMSFRQGLAERSTFLGDPSDGTHPGHRWHWVVGGPENEAEILVIVAAAALFSWILTINGVPQAITAGLKALELPPWGFLMVVNVILLIVGCFLDPTSAIIVLTPLFIPIVKSLGIDPIHFGIVMTVNIAIGMFTPPFGLNLFVAQTVLGIPLDTLYRGVLPFAVVQIAALLIITYWPALTLVVLKTF